VARKLILFSIIYQLFWISQSAVGMNSLMNSLTGIKKLKEALAQRNQISPKKFNKKLGDLSQSDKKLFFAVWDLQLSKAVELIKHGANVSAINTAGQNPLHILMQDAAQIVGMADPYKSYIDLIYQLSCNGANVNIQDKYGNTPLHYLYYHFGYCGLATVSNPDPHCDDLCRISIEPAKSLIQQTNLFLQNNNGETIVHSAIREAIQNHCTRFKSFLDSYLVFLLQNARFSVKRAAEQNVKSKKRILTFSCALNRSKKENSCFALPNELKMKILSHMPEEIYSAKLLEHILKNTDYGQWPDIISDCLFAWTEKIIAGNPHIAGKMKEAQLLVRRKKIKELLAIKDNNGKTAYDYYNHIAEIEQEAANG
jgi:hypothetical protein